MALFKSGKWIFLNFIVLFWPLFLSLWVGAEALAPSYVDSEQVANFIDAMKKNEVLTEGEYLNLRAQAGEMSLDDFNKIKNLFAFRMESKEGKLFKGKFIIDDDTDFERRETNNLNEYLKKIFSTEGLRNQD